MDIESFKEENRLMKSTMVDDDDNKDPINNNDDDDDNNNRSKKKKKMLLIWLSITLLLTMIVLFTILGLTVFKVKKPITTVKSMTLEDLKFSLNIANLSVHLNATLNVDLTIKNPNSVGFKYSRSSTILKYRGLDVGGGPFPAGRVGAHDTDNMNITITMMGDRLLSDNNLYSDVVSGMVPFTTEIKLSGKVHVLFKIKVTVYTVCDIDIDVVNASIASQSCRYRTKI